MLITVWLLISLIFSGCASFLPHPREWTKGEKVAATFFIAAHTVNALTTEAHQDSPELYYERNPILGRHPSDTEIVSYFSLTGVTTLAIAHFYPETRKPLLYGYGGVNCYLAVRDIEMMEKNY